MTTTTVVLFRLSSFVKK